MTEKIVELRDHPNGSKWLSIQTKALYAEITLSDEEYAQVKGELKDV